MRFIGRREGVAPELRRADGAGPRSKTAGNDADHAVRRLQLRRPGGDPRRRARASPAATEEEFRALPLRARDARPRPDHPHERRAAALELPAVAVGLLRAGLHRRAVAGLLARRLRGRAGRVTTRASAASGAADGERAAPPRAAPRAARRARRGALGPRRADPRRDPGDRVRDRRSSRAAAGCSRSALLRARRRLPARAVHDARARAPGAARAASSASSGLVAAGALRRRSSRCCWRSSARCRVLFLLDAWRRRSASGVTLAIAATLLGDLLDRPALAHAVLLREPAARRRDRDRRARRHVRRRHRRLPRRALVRHAARWRRGSRRTRRSRGSSIGIARRGRSASGSPGSTRTGCSATDALLLGVASALAAPIGDLFESLDQARRGRQGHRARCSAPTAARWTASTPRCSRSSPATTSGWRCL